MAVAVFSVITEVVSSCHQEMSVGELPNQGLLCPQGDKGN